MKKYKTTKEECEQNIIQSGFVCEHCGRIPVAIETVDNSGSPTHWAGCYHTDNPETEAWGVFTSGVEKEVYELAVSLVLEDGHFSVSRSDKIKDEDHFEYKFREAVARASHSLRHIEAVKKNGARYTKDGLKSLFLP